MNNTLGLISAFLGGAIVGAGAALLFAPEKGSELRTRIADILRKKGIIALTATLMPSSTNLLKIFRQKCAINRNTSCYFRPGKLNISGRK